MQPDQDVTQLGKTLRTAVIDYQAAEEAIAAPLVTAVAQNDANPGAAATNSATADEIVGDFGDEFDSDTELVDSMFADALFEHELEELLV